MTVTIRLGDCRRLMATMPAGSVDAIVTDPPYELGFMGKTWDNQGVAYDPATWTACLRVLKPGGHLLVFGGTRTWHRMAVAVEDAGFEIRDTIAWLYGSGFPKSSDVSKAIDKAAGATRVVVGKSARHVSGKPGQRTDGMNGSSTFAETIGMGSSITAPATDAARQWQGWGTALKPAHEPILVARKAVVGTVAANVLAHGTGALNIDGCRIGTETRVNAAAGNKPGGAALHMSVVGMPEGVPGREATGRWPANVALDEPMAAALDDQSGISRSSNPSPNGRYGEHRDTGGNVILGRGLSSATPNRPPIGDTGGASRFFYVAKAPTRERPKVDGLAHPTVKPLTLLRWLVRLVTPPGGVVLDPFAGSGTTAEAALLEGFDAIVMENEPDYLPLIKLRLDRSA